MDQVIGSLVGMVIGWAAGALIFFPDVVADELRKLRDRFFKRTK